MFWHGLSPFSGESSVVDNLIFTLDKVPKIIVDSGFSWDTVLSAFIAGFIPALIALISILLSNKVAESNRLSQNEIFDKDRSAQLDIAKNNINVQILSTNRQVWINNVRDCAADYLSQVHTLKNIKVFFRVAKKNDGNLINVIDNHYAVAERFITESGKLVALDCKLRLLINPLEDEAIEIFSLMDTIKDNTGAVSSTDKRPDLSEMKRCRLEIMKLLQTYLKKEWERVKRME